MTHRQSNTLVVAALTLLLLVLLQACGDGDAGLSRSEVEEIVRTELAKTPASPQPEPGLTSMPQSEQGLSKSEVEEMVQAAIDAIPEPQAALTAAQVEEAIRRAMADIPQPEPGLTTDEAERIARGVVASIPPKSAPAEYTKFFVNNAISRYETQGLEATLAYYNREESIDGQWYVFIIDENDLVVGHPDPDRLGLDLKGWVGLDANGYNFGPEMLSATEEGKWVSYVYKNPQKNPGTGSISPEDLSDVDLKNAWIVRHDGLLFASGWYIDVDQFTQDIVAAVVDQFRSVGLEGTIEYFTNNPGDVLGGVAASAASYNTSGAVEGEWSIFIADRSGTIVVHFNPAMIGTRIEDLLGADTLEIDEDGIWLTSESMRIWVVSSDGWVFGAGWHHDEAAN